MAAVPPPAMVAHTEAMQQEHESIAKPDSYMLQRNHLAATRLNAQHDLWRKELGYNLHPSISLPQTDPLSKSQFSDNAFCIADVAIGTGIWTLELARQYPHISFDAFDVDTSQAPPPSWLPNNVHLHKWDMMSALGPPPGCRAKYDVVHLRLVILAIEQDASPLIRNLLAMLKPGGCLQWDELNWDDRMLRHCEEQHGQSPGSSITKLSELMYERASVSWCLQMPEILAEHGFDTVQRMLYKPRLELLKYATDLIVLVWDEILENRKDDSSERAIMFTRLVAGMRADVANGSGLAYGKAVTIARKPLV